MRLKGSVRQINLLSLFFLLNLNFVISTRIAKLAPVLTRQNSWFLVHGYKEFFSVYTFLRKIYFPKTSSENCTFTVCFKMGKRLISQLLPFFRLKIDGKVQFSSDALGKITCFTRGDQAIVNCSFSSLVKEIAISPKF